MFIIISEQSKTHYGILQFQSRENRDKYYLKYKNIERIYTAEERKIDGKISYTIKCNACSKKHCIARKINSMKCIGVAEINNIE
jgi:translation initiation factor 2 beta subunit (eIF-2beta)/eIF-5